MKKIAYYLSVISISTLIFTSCDPENINPNGGDNNVEDSTAQKIDDYLPSKEGNYWIYNSTDGEQYKREATGIVENKAGLEMQKFKFIKLSNSDDNPEYFNRFDDKDYYTLFTFDSSETNPQYIPLIVLKDNPTLDMTWTNTGIHNDPTYGDIQMKATCKIMSVSETVALDDTTFHNAIRMKATLEGKHTATTWLDCGSINFWFVKGVGIVKQDFNIKLSLFGMELYKNSHIETLQEFHIQN